MSELLGHGDDDSLSLDLPIFANEQCKNLALKNRQYESSLEEAQFELEENIRRTSIMEEYMHNIRMDVGELNKMQEAKCAEVETESHMCSGRTGIGPPCLGIQPSAQRREEAHW